MTLMGTQLKICGLMRQEDVAVCCRAGVDICGFVTEYPLAVPWNLTREQCTALIQGVTMPTKSCIVTGGEPEKIILLALTVKPDLVQLHYRETLKDTITIVQSLAPHGIGVIKTIPNLAAERLRQFGTEDIELSVRRLCETGAYAILVDSRGPSNATGGGTTADLSFCCRVKTAAACLVMLGGGIKPENCLAAITEANPDIIDVMTGVELSPGVKSAEQITKLVHLSAMTRHHKLI